MSLRKTMGQQMYEEGVTDIIAEHSVKMTADELKDLHEQ